MKKGNAILFLFLVGLFFTCCKGRDFPEVKLLSDYKKTNFLSTIEDSLSLSKNNIYASSFLYAWAEIRKEVGSLKVEEKYTELTLVNNAVSYQNSLKGNELETKVAIEGTKITASAYFKKSLPFEIKLVRFPQPMVFQNEKVESFGVYGASEEKFISEILYYKNDSDFVIRLNPKDKDHEILLYNPSESSLFTFKELLSSLNSKIVRGKKEMYSDSLGWKYCISGPDFLQIPVLGFNIETQYDSIVGSIFTSLENEYVVVKAEQRTAFILDELGAEVESEATIVADLTSALPEPVEHPKRMVFNKPFLIVLKRRDAVNPYFMAWINNSELMTKK